MRYTGCEAVEMWCFGLGTTCQDNPVKGSGERRNQPLEVPMRWIISEQITICFSRAIIHGDIHSTCILGPGQLRRYSNWDTDERRQILSSVHTASRPVLTSTQSPIQRLMVALLAGVKRKRCKPDHSLLSSAEIKNEWRYTSNSL